MIFLWIFLIFFAYLLPLYFAYKYFRIAYSKNGIYAGCKPAIHEMIFVLLPAGNIGMMLSLSSSSPYSKAYLKSEEYRELQRKKQNKRNLADVFFRTDKTN